MMRKALLSGLVLCCVTLAYAAEGDFTRSISPENFKAAGLDRLTPDQLQRLNELITGFKQDLVTTARQSAEEARAAKQKAEEAVAAQRAAEASARLAKDELKAATAEAAESKTDRKGFFAKAKVMIVPGTKIEYAEIKSTVLGPFEGWKGRTTFRLANGQRWQVFNSNEDYFTPPQENVEVQIRPAVLGGYWMFFPAFDKQVRVKLLETK
jgi:multidrug efflux pump subunit AcrA (membrane-fusion protein)